MIYQEHLNFLEECIEIFEEEPFRETITSDDDTLIALRYGMDRDCIYLFRLDGEVGFFAQMMKPCRIKKEVVESDFT